MNPVAGQQNLASLVATALQAPALCFYKVFNRICHKHDFIISQAWIDSEPMNPHYLLRIAALLSPCIVYIPAYFIEAGMPDWVAGKQHSCLDIPPPGIGLSRRG